MSGYRQGAFGSNWNGSRNGIRNETRLSDAILTFVAVSIFCPASKSRHVFVAKPSCDLRRFCKMQWQPTCLVRSRMLDPVANRIEHYMDLLSRRQKLVASNIANIDTPGYRTRDIDFQFEFMSLVQGGKPNIIEPDLPVKNDGNNVSLDREARLLAENSMRFNLAAQLMRSHIRMVRSAIKEGREG